MPCVPDSGLQEKGRKELQKRRDCANQIHKAAVAINSTVLAEMEVPESYLAPLPKVRQFYHHMIPNTRNRLGIIIVFCC